MSSETARALIDKYIAGTCTDEECATVEAWYAQWNQDLPDSLSEGQLQAALQRVQDRLPAADQKSTFLIWKNWIAAAAIVIMTSAGIWFFTFRNTNLSTSQSSVSLMQHDLSPASNKAVLTLPNGKTVNLSNTKTGIVIDINKLTYNDGTEISTPNSDKEESGSSTKQMIVSTPRGGTYQVILPDGSKVSLNAASTLKFPANFQSEKIRNVQLIGEAYFEVSKDQSKPFLVESENQQVKVLGTHFNINAYPGQPYIKTTLIEGSVNVSSSAIQSDKQVVTLRPNQQAILKAHKFQVSEANIKEAIAWKEGYFIFNGERLVDIMQQISRWYAVEVIFKDDVQNVPFTGVISNTKNISTVLQAIAESGNVHFKIKEGRVIIMK